MDKFNGIKIVDNWLLNNQIDSKTALDDFILFYFFW